MSFEATGRSFAPVPVRGIAAAELAERAHVHALALGADQLQRWLVTEGYAVAVDGLLFPSSRLVDLASTLPVVVLDE